jgi:hypothetical protein
LSSKISVSCAESMPMNKVHTGLRYLFSTLLDQVILYIIAISTNLQNENKCLGLDAVAHDCDPSYAGEHR